MTRPALARLTRDADAPLLFESFFVAAVASFLAIRSFLAATGYPKVGSNGLHIAHMLWGGLLMLVALMLLFSFLDRSIQHLAAVVAGLGFGTFVDEIGKFITADNDYFFRPAVALIYVVFVVVFLVAHVLAGARRLSQEEALANALELMEGTVGGAIEPDLRSRIARLLEQADPKAPLVRVVERYIAELPEVPRQPGRTSQLSRRLVAAYEHVMAQPWAERGLAIAVVAYAVAAVIGVTIVALAAPAAGGPDAAGVATVGQVASTIAGAALVGFGVLRLPASRVAAFRWFMRGLLVWILVTQVFVFYSSQLAGIGGLAVNLVAYASLRLAVTREIVAGRHRIGRGVAAAEAPPP